LPSLPEKVLLGSRRPDFEFRTARCILLHEPFFVRQQGFAIKLRRLDRVQYIGRIPFLDKARCSKSLPSRQMLSSNPADISAGKFCARNGNAEWNPPKSTGLNYLLLVLKGGLAPISRSMEPSSMN